MLPHRIGLMQLCYWAHNLKREREMQTTGKKVITRVLGLTHAPCMDTYTNSIAQEPGLEQELLAEVDVYNKLKTITRQIHPYTRMCGRIREWVQG